MELAFEHVCMEKAQYQITILSLLSLYIVIITEYEMGARLLLGTSLDSRLSYEFSSAFNCFCFISKYHNDKDSQVQIVGRLVTLTVELLSGWRTSV